jgi:hypothetical protein
MKKKNLFLGISALALVFGLYVGCASAPAVPKTTQAGAAVLGGKTAIILPVTLAERIKATSRDTPATSLPEMMQVSMTADEYARGVDEVVKRNSDACTDRIEAGYASFIEAYNAAFNTTLVKANFDFGKNAPKINYFAKPSKDAAAQIAQLCADNNAEYAVAILYQFADGPVVTSITVVDTTALRIYAYVLDKTGQVVAINYGNTDEVTFIIGKVQPEEKEEQLILQLFDGFKDGLAGLVTGL